MSEQKLSLLERVDSPLKLYRKAVDNFNLPIPENLLELTLDQIDKYVLNYVREWAAENNVSSDMLNSFYHEGKSGLIKLKEKARSKLKIDEEMINWYKKNVIIGTRPWGERQRRWLSEKFNIDDKSTRLVESILLSALHHKEVWIVGTALEKIKKDPDFINFKKEICDIAGKDKRFKKAIFSLPPYKRVVTFGGERGSFNFFSKESYPTWVVAFQELTWLLRHAEVQADVTVNITGILDATFFLHDKFDLRIDSQRIELYNDICMALGFLYHDVLGNTDKLEHKARWKEKITFFITSSGITILDV